MIINFLMTGGSPYPKEKRYLLVAHRLSLTETNSIFFHLVSKHPLAQAEIFGCPGLDPVVLMEGLHDPVPFDLLEDLR